jgi:hypothetical protein
LPPTHLKDKLDTVGRPQEKGDQKMKKSVAVMLVVALVALSIFSLGGVASAEEIKMVGVITKIDIAGKDAKTATATLKDNKSGNLVVITVNDELTLDKFKDHRIVEGDEIRCKYDVVNGKNVSKLFRKTAGC